MHGHQSHCDQLACDAIDHPCHKFPAAGAEMFAGQARASDSALESTFELAERRRRIDLKTSA
jgi:hypothetical protein